MQQQNSNKKGQDSPNSVQLFRQLNRQSMESCKGGFDKSKLYNKQQTTEGTYVTYLPKWLHLSVFNKD